MKLELSEHSPGRFGGLPQAWASRRTSGAMKMELPAAAASLGESFYRIYLPVLLVDDLLLLHELLAELLLGRLV